jgi:hypothetical protein
MRSVVDEVALKEIYFQIIQLYPVTQSTYPLMYHMDYGE